MKIFESIRKTVAIYNAYNTKYNVARNSASLSFYMLLSVVCLLIIVFQIVASASDILETVLLPRIIVILSASFSDTLRSVLPTFSLSSFSTIIFLNLIWAASKTINGYNRIADFIYYEVKPRVGFISRISAFLMFSMLILVFIFEMFIVFIGNYLIRKITAGNSYWTVKLVQFILELFVIFLTVLILYIYTPPKKMRFRDAYKGAVFATLMLYILLSLYVIIINAFNRLGIGYSIITVLSLSLLVLYYGNYIIITGMIVNYFGSFFQLKKSLFCKQ
ncbi:MAG: YihY/virulence factor BrkB family protein [Bacilli bacterium]|nr:YihY/virulence factor BrkB family protein [Bacilli bacterium]MDD4077515.1 YihY/virulence factor BrkB family protein [Bacilli bacterium]MDD4388670.1 YihY/virulence factor BrkB family protein [Bacilli bacterium]